MSGAARPRTGDVEFVGPDRLRLGEGVRFVDGEIVLVDIVEGRLLRVVPDHGETPLEGLARVTLPLGAVAPLADRPGVWIAAVGDGLAVLEPPGDLTWIAHLEADRPVELRMNDAAADPAGRFFAGSMATDGTPEAGRLWRLDPDGTTQVVLDGISIPNGPAFDRERAVAYLADSAKGLLWRIPVDQASGDLGTPVELALFAPGEGSPDGMTVDDEGRLWVACWGAACVRCLSPDGEELARVPVPATQPASVALTPTRPGRLWVASATVELEAPGPLDGALFYIPVDATAPPADPVRLAR